MYKQHRKWQHHTVNWVLRSKARGRLSVTIFAKQSAKGQTLNYWASHLTVAYTADLQHRKPPNRDFKKYLTKEEQKEISYCNSDIFFFHKINLGELLRVFIPLQTHLFSIDSGVTSHKFFWWGLGSRAFILKRNSLGENNIITVMKLKNVLT